MQAFWNEFKYPVIFGGIGLMIAILFLTIGFLKALLIVIFTVLGIYLGFLLQRMDFFDRFEP